MNPTKIAWTDYTSNPLRAERVIDEDNGTIRVMDGHYCEKVGPGCAHCYASAQNARGAYPKASTGLAYPANPPGSKYDEPPVERRMVRFYLNERELLEWQKPKYAGKRCFAFDMTDLFGEWVVDEDLDKIFAAMATSPATFQVPEQSRLLSRDEDPAKLQVLIHEVSVYIHHFPDVGETGGFAVLHTFASFEGLSAARLAS